MLSFLKIKVYKNKKDRVCQVKALLLILIDKIVNQLIEDQEHN